MKQINKKRILNSVLLVLALMLFSFILTSFMNCKTYAEENLFTYDEIKDIKDNEEFEKDGKRYVIKDGVIYEIVEEITEEILNENKTLKLKSIGMSKSFDSGSEEGMKSYLYSIALAIPKVDNTTIINFSPKWFDLIYLKYATDVLITNESSLSDRRNLLDYAVGFERKWGSPTVGEVYIPNDYYGVYGYKNHMNSNGQFLNNIKDFPIVIKAANINNFVSGKVIENELIMSTTDFFKPKYNIKDNEILQYSLSYIGPDNENNEEYYEKNLGTVLDNKYIKKRINTNQTINYVNYHSNLNFFQKFFRNELFNQYIDPNKTFNNFELVTDNNINDFLIDNEYKVNLASFYNANKDKNNIYVLYFDFYETNEFYEYITKSKDANGVSFRPGSDETAKTVRIIEDLKIYQNVEIVELNADITRKNNVVVNKNIKVQNKPIDIIVPSIPENKEPEIFNFSKFFKKMFSDIEAFFKQSKHILKYVLYAILGVLGLFVLVFIFKILQPVVYLFSLPFKAMSKKIDKAEKVQPYKSRKIKTRDRK